MERSDQTTLEQIEETFSDGVPTLSVWAPTARQVRLHLFDDANPNTKAEILTMRPTPSNGTWAITGAADWAGKYYLYEVQVYVPTEGSVQTNLVTDPYSSAWPPTAPAARLWT